MARPTLSLAALAILAVGCSKTPPAQAELEKQFQQMMTGATMVGYSTRTNKEGLSGEERYAIEKVSKIGGETWLIQARMKYGGHDIPGVGTYTARVLFYRDQYAGTWSGEKGGGQLFGKIVRGQ